MASLPGVESSLSSSKISSQSKKRPGETTDRDRKGESGGIRAGRAVCVIRRLQRASSTAHSSRGRGTPKEGGNRRDGTRKRLKRGANGTVKKKMRSNKNTRNANASAMRVYERRTTFCRTSLLSGHPSCILCAPPVRSLRRRRAATAASSLRVPLKRAARPGFAGPRRRSFISLDFKALKQVSKSRPRKNRSASAISPPSFVST